MHRLILGFGLLAAALCRPVFAQESQPIHLQSQPFVLQVREGDACDLSNQGDHLLDANYRGEKICRVVSQTSIPGETRKVMFYTVASGPESFGILDLAYVPPHAARPMHLYQSGPLVKSRRLAICVTASAPLQEGLGVILRAAVNPGGDQLSTLCALSGNYIGSYLANADAPATWTNLAISPRHLGSSENTPYLVQFRILLSARSPQ